jgi:ADP-heptose:LPS heptosyltransferase
MNNNLFKTLLIDIKSILDFLVLKILQIITISKFNNSSNILFINTGQIGDLVISSTLLEYDEVYGDQIKTFFLIRKEYSELFADYEGKIEIIEVNLAHYRYNFFYRMKFNRMLKKHKINTVYNLTSTRPTWNDTLALGIGAEKTYCFANNWQFEQKLFANYINQFYTNKLSVGLYNEYDRINSLVDALSDRIKKSSISKTKVFKLYQDIEKYDIIISPFSSSKIKDWDINKFKDLIYIISQKWKVLLIGAKNQNANLTYLKNKRKNVSIIAGNIKLNKLFSYFVHTKIFIGLDSGLSHFALKANKRNIILVGGGSYGMYFPIPGDKSTIYLTNRISCFGCDWKCVHKKNLCLFDINISEVLNNMNKLITS